MLDAIIDAKFHNISQQKQKADKISELCKNKCVGLH